MIPKDVEQSAFADIYINEDETETNPNIRIPGGGSHYQPFREVFLYSNLLLALLSGQINRATFNNLSDIVLGATPATYSIELLIKNDELQQETTTNNVIEIDTTSISLEEEGTPVATKQYISLSEALKLEEEIYSRLQERQKSARQAEANYWKFLDDEDHEG